jgi:hypothetical protein
MSNQRKVELVNGSFGIQSFWEGDGKNSSNPDLDLRSSLPRIGIEQTGQVSDTYNS